MNDRIIELKCVLIDLQHSKGATTNIMKYTAYNKVYIICIEEHYIYQGRAAGLDFKYRNYTAGVAQYRTAITIRNKAVDALLISQLSKEGSITLEKARGDTTLILASMYWDRQNPSNKN